MDNHEDILDALTAFGKSPNPQEIPSVLEQYLNSVAKNGETLFPWSQLKPLILRKMEIVFTDLRHAVASENIPNRPNVENVRFDVIHARIIDSLHKFNGAPFTIQRLCELLIEPKRHYKRSDKFMRGLEKNVLVVSTVDPFGRKVVCESGNKPMLNGILDINGSHPRDSGLSIPLPPVPGWVTTSSTTVKASTKTAPTVTPLDSHKSGAGSNDEKLVKDSDSLGSTCVSGGLTVSGSVFVDQGEPLTVQSEEVVEETVVTMDTGEVSSVVTDGGEGMAEREIIEADMTDDREASSFSSSSSSSSEELSTSFDNGQRVSPFGATVSEESGLEENRPWAAFAQDAKHQDAATCHPSHDKHPVENMTDENQTSGVSSSSPQHNTLSEASSSLSSSSSTLVPSSDSSLTSSTTSCKTDDEHQDLPHQTSNQPNLQRPSQDSCDPNQSTGFDPDTVNSAVDDMTSSSLTELDKQASSTTTMAVTTTSHIPGSIIPAAASSSSSNSVLTYAQVVASSTDNTSTLHPLAPYDTSETVPCDSVAGLERLVGSMEQSLSSSSPSSSTSVIHLSSSSSPSSSSQPLIPQDLPSSVTTTSSTSASLTQGLTSTSDCCSSDGEPASKRLRLSNEKDNMEEDCISTSGDSCMDEEVDSKQTQEEEQIKQSTVDSSMDGDVEPVEPKQVEGNSSECDQGERESEMVEESSTVGLDSTGHVCSGDDQLRDSHVDSGNNDGIDTCCDVADQKNPLVSNDEVSAVSTTDDEENHSLESTDN